MRRSSHPTRPGRAARWAALLLVLVAALLITGPARIGSPTAAAPRDGSGRPETGTTGNLDPPAVPTTGGDPVRQDRPPDLGDDASVASADGVTLVDQTDWVGLGEPFDLRLGVGADVPADGAVVLDLHTAVTSRSQFAATLEGRFLGARRAEVIVPLSELAVQPDGTRQVRLTSGPTAVPGERTVQGMSRPGVYPLVVGVRPADPEVEPPAPFTTYLVRTPPEGTTPLRVAVVQPVHAPPARQPDGSTRFEADVLGQLEALAEVLASSSGTPLTLTPRPETLEALTMLAATEGAADAGRAEAVLADLRAALPDRQVVSEPWVDVDPDALEAAGLGEDLPAQRLRGDAAVDAVLGTRTDARTWVADGGLGPDALERLATVGVDQVLLPDSALSPVDLRLSLTRPFAIGGLAVGSTLRGAAPEPALSARYAAEDPVLAAQHVLADLAVLHGDEPGPLRPRGVVLAPGPGVDADPGFLQAVLSGLASSPILRPVTLDGYFSGVDPQVEEGGPLVRTVAPAGGSLGVVGSEIESARARLTGFASMLADPTDLRDLSDLTLLAEAAELQLAQRRAYLAAVGAGVDARLGRVDVVDAAIRLADSEGTIPLTLVRDGDAPLSVRVTLASEQLAFGPDRRESRWSYDLELTSENTPLVVPVRVRSPGTFPLLVTITSPDGRLQIARTQVTIRSTAFSGVGVALSAGAGFFLLLWWVRHWRTVRRAKRLVPVT
ncbi:MAG: hypothetical protein AVDCRST_MAG20-1346 [uncultured Acidimicrobiales bacterium]|uniref:Uncharacterized protein n=1 Tax=uncultured Acidimicrobiales bacterium TaxID=310071 RepID=A0A6J4HU74_9ACTN|nr:MAG: hypothetical protein AVDCRST_MAG20-1346 [uncultured Acidimicrobiales bacterium]